MKIALVAVMSINNKITQGSDTSIFEWASNEDGDFFKKLLSKHQVFIMGNTTYKTIKPRPSHEKLRIVMSHNPKDHKEEHVAGHLEFTSAAPVNIVADLVNRRYGSALLLGGSEIYSLFLDAGLVSDMYLTIEPSIFSGGLGLANKLSHNINCELITVDVLNKAGTVLLHYKNL